MKMKINKKIADYIKQRKRNGKKTFLIMGSRRSGKTYTISQYLVLKAYNRKTTINVAGITMEQLRNGVYSDMKEIIESEPCLSAVFEFFTSPREIRNKVNGSRISFNSYQNPETAKGFKCDYLYMNELNNFSKEQYYALTPNVREGFFGDWNPTKHFYIEDLYAPDEILHTTWKDNPFLTDLQKEYFHNLKRAAEKVGASSVDIWAYKVNYLGEYSNDLAGEIFKADNINIIETLPEKTKSYKVFIDPSSLRGSDYTAATLSCVDDEMNYYIIDSLLQNKGTYEEVGNKLVEWEKSYGPLRIYVETNGYVGIEFFEFLRRNYKRLSIQGWCSKGNKFERIISQYGNITRHTYFLNFPGLQNCLDMMYDFGEKCDFDDYPDCLASTILMQDFK